MIKLKDLLMEAVNVAKQSTKSLLRLHGQMKDERLSGQSALLFRLITKELVKRKVKLESVNEGRYHDYRNDESLSPKQKIGYSMREVRDKLNELDKLVKINVRFKNEVGVDSSSYWKNTHRSMNKISERLVKLANKVGQLY